MAASNPLYTEGYTQGDTSLTERRPKMTLGLIRLLSKKAAALTFSFLGHFSRNKDFFARTPSTIMTASGPSIHLYVHSDFFSNEEENGDKSNYESLVELYREFLLKDGRPQEGKLVETDLAADPRKCPCRVAVHSSITCYTHFYSLYCTTRTVPRVDATLWDAFASAGHSPEQRVGSRPGQPRFANGLE